MLLFANSRGEAETLASILKDKSRMPVELHHGSLSRQTREETESMLREGGRGIVVCTSSLELGIDMSSVDTVIHYESPRQVSRPGPAAGQEPPRGREGGLRAGNRPRRQRGHGGARHTRPRRAG